MIHWGSLLRSISWLRNIRSSFRIHLILIHWSSSHRFNLRWYIIIIHRLSLRFILWSYHLRLLIFISIIIHYIINKLHFYPSFFFPYCISFTYISFYINQPLFWCLLFHRHWCLTLSVITLNGIILLVIHWSRYIILTVLRSWKSIRDISLNWILHIISDNFFKYKTLLSRRNFFLCHLFNKLY